MKIAVFGVGGRIGTRIAEEALSRGHDVTGAARTPARVKDFAVALIDEVEKPRHVRQRFTAAY